MDMFTYVVADKPFSSDSSLSSPFFMKTHSDTQRLQYGITSICRVIYDLFQIGTKLVGTLLFSFPVLKELAITIAST